MSKKKNRNKKKNPSPPQPAVRLSLCMIVKDEEKNIEQALGWAKNIAFEQIVVDTGSSDKTVEIAEKMGAKVYHFKWINDFSAAKNFAIEKATGNWIAALDADEYFSQADAKKLMAFLKQIQADAEMREKYPALGCELVNVGDDGKPSTVTTQLRIFRNMPKLRYIGRIHERLDVDVDNTLILDGIKIIHTGYTTESMTEKKKTERNAELLRAELEKSPGDLNLKAYLADVLRLNKDDKSKIEAEQIFNEVINSADASVHKELKHKAYIFFVSKYMDEPAKLKEYEDICQKALAEFPGNLDFEYFLAVALNKKGDYDTAREMLKRCEEKLSDPEALNESIYVSANPDLLRSRFDIAQQSGSLLSFCMIVKNGEKTIAKALECVKEIAFEIIVVDTGSTDKTVVIAEQMGAKVLYFEWINDFAAARNYSIEQATGDWILMLDADEYFLPEDVQKLSDLLKKIYANPKKWKDCPAISCVGVNLNDNGRPMTRGDTVHLFRNIPAIRFTGRIHEGLTIDKSKVVHAGDIFLMHTGYSKSTHEETGKAQRNIAMLRAELQTDPENMTLKAYLANSLSISNDEKSQTEAEKLFAEILNSKAGKSVDSWQKIKMYIFLITKHMDDSGRLSESEEMCRKALMEFPGTMDFEYLLAVVLTRKGDNDAAWELLKACESKVIDAGYSDKSIMIPADPTAVFSQMIITANNRGDIENVVMYSTHILTMDKNRMSVLSPCIATLLHYGVSENEIIGLLSNIYDFKDNDDLQIVIQAAGDCGAEDFAGRISELYSR